MTGARSRRKGATNERRLAKLFAEAMPSADVHRGLQYQNRFSRDKVPDVECPVFWVEAKVGKKPNPRAALAQARADVCKGKIPIAVIRDDGVPDEEFVCIGLADFLDFVREWWERGDA
jgi:hypothetical protein